LQQNVPAAGAYGAVVMDDCNFNPMVNLNEFEMGRVLYFHPPDGEFTVLNYRMSGDHRAPFRVFPSVEETEPTKLDFVVHVRAEMPDNHFGANVTIEVPLPRCTAGASCNLITSGTGQSSAEYNIQDKKIVWQMKKCPGGSEQTLRAKINLSQPCTSQIRKEMGPISLNFEIPMYNVSSLQVRYLRISESMPGYAPYRWVRYVTQSSSYVTRL
jgi:AP-4 complex subunit mu-1